jgi:hypothetical protein
MSKSILAIWKEETETGAKEEEEFLLGSSLGTGCFLFGAL